LELVDLGPGSERELCDGECEAGVGWVLAPIIPKIEYARWVRRRAALRSRARYTTPLLFRGQPGRARQPLVDHFEFDLSSVWQILDFLSPASCKANQLLDLHCANVGCNVSTPKHCWNNKVIDPTVC